LAVTTLVALGLRPGQGPLRERRPFFVNGIHARFQVLAMAAPPALPLVRRVGAELALLVGFGLVMAEIGPYGTGEAPWPKPLIYWLACIVGGGVIGIAIDETLGRRWRALWLRIAVSTALMTPLVAALVWRIGEVILPIGRRPQLIALFLLQVFVVSLLLMALRALTWRPPVRVVEREVVVMAPLPEAEAAFRRRLSARRRQARLIAIQAEDHYLRVHTDAGEELVALRFADALAELAGVHGYQTHRSWWVSADAIAAVKWRKGSGEVQLAGGLAAPVSRTYGPRLKAAGWF
jgi:hypothetical protein